MGIQNLPGGGQGFRVSTGSGNLTRKFNTAVRHGELQNLSDNKGSILKVIKKYESAIRVHKFDRLRQRSAYFEIKKLEGNKLSKQDIIDTKNVLKHFSERPTAEVKAERMVSIVKADNPNPLAQRVGSGLMTRNEGSSSPSRINLQSSGMHDQGIHGSGIHGVSGPSSADLRPYEGHDRESRGKAARAELNYKHMSGLGSSKGAQKLQKDSFDQINNLLAK